MQIESVPITQAQRGLGRLIDRLRTEDLEAIWITDHGRPIAVIVDAMTYDRDRNHADA